LSANFRQRGRCPPTIVGIRKLECGVKIKLFTLPELIGLVNKDLENIHNPSYGFVTKHACDRQTDRQNYDS